MGLSVGSSAASAKKRGAVCQPHKLGWWVVKMKFGAGTDSEALMD